MLSLPYPIVHTKGGTSMKKIISSVITITFISTGMLFAQHSMSSMGKVVMGYLSDVKCATSPNGVAADGAPLTTAPERHTTACMKMASCEASGYGIFMKGANGKYSFMKFDSKGNELAKAYLKKTKRKDGHIVDVAGTAKGDIYLVESIKEASADMKM
jgi:hypothetical protein